MKTFWKRSLSSAILLGLLAYILFGNEPYSLHVFGVMAILFSYFAVFEFGTILLKSGNPFHRKTTALFVGATVAIQAASDTFIGRGYIDQTLTVVALIFIIHCWTLFLTSQNRPAAMRAIFSSAAAYFMFSIPLCLIVRFYQYPAGPGAKNFHYLFLFFILVTKIGDIAAYAVGSLSNWLLKKRGGNHKMIPSISPGKSYEGALGGFVFTILLSWLLWPCCGIETSFGPLWSSLFIGVILFFGCMGGDLAESAFKRTCAIKDSGSILPGIGGVLDLVDSTLVNAPLFYLFLKLCTNAF